MGHWAVDVLHVFVVVILVRGLHEYNLSSTCVIGGVLGGNRDILQGESSVQEGCHILNSDLLLQEEVIYCH